jgi:hypothetical protein
MIVRTRNPIRIVNKSVNSNDSFSYADDAKKTGYFSKAERDKRKADRDKKTGFFSKGKRKERKDDRIKTREERRKNRKAKYGARPLIGILKAGKKFFQDRLPKLTKKANGKFEKTNADGSSSEVDAANALIIATEAAKKAEANAIAMKAAADAAAKKAADTKSEADKANAEIARKAAEEAARKAAEEAAKQVVVDKKDVDTKQPIVLDANGQPIQNIPEGDTEKVVDEKGNEEVYKKSDVVDEDSLDTKKPMSTLVKVGIGVGAAVILGVIVYLVVRPKK